MTIASKHTKKLVVIGMSGHGKVVIETARAMNQFSSIQGLDDNVTSSSVIGVPVVGRSSQAGDFINSQTCFFVAIGNNQIREKVQTKIAQCGGELATLIHPNATVSPTAQIGAGTLVMPQAVVNACAQISEGCIVNTGATVDHDCQLGAFVHLAPGVNLAGQVEVGNKTMIGLGANVIQCMSIGSNVLVGAGATVVNEIPSNETVVGTPAKTIKNNNERRGGEHA